MFLGYTAPTTSVPQCIASASIAKSSNTTNVGAIVGGIIVAIILIGGAILSVILFLRFKKSKSQKPQNLIETTDFQKNSQKSNQ